MSSTDLLWIQFVGAALVLVDHVSRRQPVDRGVEDGHHHPAGEPLLLPQAVQVTVAHLGQRDGATEGESRLVQVWYDNDNNCFLVLCCCSSVWVQMQMGDEKISADTLVHSADKCVYIWLQQHMPDYWSICDHLVLLCNYINIHYID